MTFTAIVTATTLYNRIMNNVERLLYMVPGAGVEPARHFWRGILSF